MPKISKTSQLIKDGVVWTNESNDLCRYCPKCNRVIIHKAKLLMPCRVNDSCMSCSQLGKKVFISEEQKQKLSKALTGKYRPSAAMKEQIARSVRIACIKRRNKLGISSCVDSGANEWFDVLNSLGNKFECNKYHIDLGYWPDGYDPIQHIWMEFDTPYHLQLKQREQDLKRQYTICKYFEDIGNPLAQFVRVKAHKDGNPYCVDIVYQNPLRLNILKTYDWANQQQKGGFNAK